MQGGDDKHNHTNEDTGKMTGQDKDKGGVNTGVVGEGQRSSLDGASVATNVSQAPVRGRAALRRRDEQDSGPSNVRIARSYLARSRSR